MTEASRKSNAPALDKGLDVLELMAASDDPLSIYDISRALGRTRGELYRVLNRLVERGYVVRVGDQEKVVLGDKLFRIASDAPSTQHLIESSAPLMARIVKETGHSSLLSVRSGNFAVTVFNVASGDRVTMSSPIGSRMNLWDTAPGVAMIGAMPRYEVDLLVEGLDDVKQRELDERLTRQRKAGYALFGGDDHDRTLEVAVPFRRANQRLDAAISTVLFASGSGEVDRIGSTLAAITASNMSGST